MIKVITHGRTDLEDFFSLSGSLSAKELKHNPFLAFVTIDDETIEVCKFVSASDMASSDLSDETPVIAQWAGQWRSDFFKMTVGDVRKALDAKD